jgi:hypothetical protein
MRHEHEWPDAGYVALARAAALKTGKRAVFYCRCGASKAWEADLNAPSPFASDTRRHGRRP